MLSPEYLKASSKNPKTLNLMRGFRFQEEADPDLEAPSHKTPNPEPTPHALNPKPKS